MHRGQTQVVGAPGGADTDHLDPPSHSDPPRSAHAGSRPDRLTIRPIPRSEPEPGDRIRDLTAPTTAVTRSTARSIAERVDPGARAFAVSALTTVLEVMDRRRPVAHLPAVAVGHIVDQVTALTAARALTSGRAAPQATSLIRVHLQWAGPDAAEVSATCGRGARVHAIAARIERIPVRVRPAVPAGPRVTRLQWMLVSVTTV